MSRSEKSFCDVLQTAAWQTDVMGVIFGAADDPRLVIRRQTHRLRLVELGILKGRKPEQSIPEAWWQLILGEINLVAESQFQALRQRTGNRGFLPAARGRRSPRLGIVLVLHSNADAHNTSAPLSITNDLLNGGPIDLADRR